MTTKIKQTGIADLAVGQGQLSADSVTAAKIVDGAVGQAEIGTDAVQADEIVAGAVGSSEIADGAITTDDIAVSARPVFTKSYESAQQTITSAGSLTLAHGLGVKPKLLYAVLQCTTAELNYSIGDEVAVNVGSSVESALDCGVSLVPDATNINVRYGGNANAFTIINKGNGNASQITNASWRLVVRAWA